MITIISKFPDVQIFDIYCWYTYTRHGYVGRSSQLYSYEWFNNWLIHKDINSQLNVLCNRYVLDRARVFLCRMLGMITKYEMINIRNSLSIPFSIDATLIISNKTANMYPLNGICCITISKIQRKATDNQSAVFQSSDVLSQSTKSTFYFRLCKFGKSLWWLSLLYEVHDIT